MMPASPEVRLPSGQPGPPLWSWLLVLAACFSTCMAIDYLYFPSGTIFPDEQRFLASAIRLAASGEYWIGSDRAWEMPGTAIFYAPFVLLAGPEGAVRLIRVAQALLLSGQVVLIGHIAIRIYGSRLIALWASTITAFYPFLLFYQGVLLSEMLFITLMLASILALYCWYDRGMRIDGALLMVSAFFVAATLTKATLTFFPPLLIGATAFLAGRGIRRSLTILIAALLLFSTLMSPWWLRNAAVLGAFVPFATGSAQNLYLGNNPRNPDAGIDWASNVDRAESERMLKIPDEVARQSAFAQAARDYIIESPVTFMQAAAKKFIRFWNIIPNAAEYRTGIHALISAMSFGPVLLLAIAGVFRNRWRWRRLAPLYLLIGYFTVLHMIAIASLRYRLPIEPLLIVLAAEPLASMVGRVWRRLFRSPGRAD